jgi:hypothetical protein
MSLSVGLASVPRVASALPPPKAAPAKKPMKAGSTDDARRAEARNHYADAEARFQNGDYEGAYAQYKAANDLMMAPQTLYKMAVCLDRLDKTNDAISAYQAFLGSGPPASMDAKVNEVQARVADLKKKLPALLRVKSDPPAASVVLDGATQSGATPLDVKTTAGHHRIRVTASGYEPYEREVDLEAGSETIFEAPLPKAGSAENPAASPPVAETPPADKPPSPEPEQRSNAPAYVVLGLAGAGAVVGAIFGIKALGEKSDYDNASPQARTADMADAVERDALIADMTLGGALTLGVTGIVLLVSNSGSPAPDKSARLAPRPGFQVSPLLSKGGAGAAATLHF